MKPILNLIFNIFLTYFWVIPCLLIIAFTFELRYIKFSPPPVLYENITLDDSFLTHPFSEFTFHNRSQNPLPSCHQPPVSYNVSFFTSLRKDAPSSLLCKLNMDKHCTSMEVAEVIETFWVICPVYSSFQSFIQYRYTLHNDYKAYIESFGLSFSTIEAIRKDRNQEYLVTQPSKEPYDIQVFFYDDMYIRENLLNVAVKKIEKYKDWSYIAWIDAHQPFENVYWWEESIVKMEKYATVQNFQYLENKDLENKTFMYSPSGTQMSFFITSFNRAPLFLLGNSYSIERSWYEKVGYIFDECVASCCDCAWLLGSVPPSYVFGYFNKYRKYNDQMLEWINRTQSIMKGSRAIARGKLYHLFHEHNFGYVQVIELMNQSEFSFKKDLKRDENGTLMLANEEVKKLFSKNNFWTNFMFYAESYDAIFYFINIFVIVVVSLVACCISSRRRKNTEYASVDVDMDFRDMPSEDNKMARYVI